MTKYDYTVAVVGCGRISQGAHFPGFAKLGNVRVKYACDLIPEKAQAMKDKYDFVENVITDYKIALADPEVTAVFVFTPNYAHYTVSMDALRAGKHVLCEKPITINYALSKEMADEAVSVRSRKTGDMGVMYAADFIEFANKQIEEKVLDN